VVKIQVKVPWVVMPYNVVVEYQCFRSPCCLHLQGEVEIVINFIITQIY
jgi:hypothetical protein